VLKFCLKSFLVGTAVALLLYFGLLLVGPRAGLLALLCLVAWPTEILLMGDMAGITTPTVVLLVGISAVGNGLVYALLGMLFDLYTRNSWWASRPHRSK
jgi:hypothetical protein